MTLATEFIWYKRTGSHPDTYTYVNTVGLVIQGPSDVIYFPGVTPLPIELICNVTGVAAWRINGTDRILGTLGMGIPAGHNHSGTNVLINIPTNNTEYICLSQTNDDTVPSEPAFLYVAGEYCITPNFCGVKFL